jgi:GTP-binding protein Era
MSQKKFKAGYVAIIGKPNAGKSTLLNQVVGQKLCIVTPKAQTTRHRILGIVSTDEYQMVFNDTPGIMKPQVELHHRMLRAVRQSVRDADVALWLAALDETFPEDLVFEALAEAQCPLVVALNKQDRVSTAQADAREHALRERLPQAQAWHRLSALHNTGVQALLDTLVSLLPESPPYYDPEQVTDLPVRFFAAELIREQVFLHYEEEIPYGVEVVIQSYRETPDRVYIDADLHVPRAAHIPIIIGKKGEALRRMSTAARLAIETFIEQPVFLNLHVRVTENWTDRPGYLRNFGYSDK